MMKLKEKILGISTIIIYAICLIAFWVLQNKIYANALQVISLETMVLPLLLLLIFIRSDARKIAFAIFDIFYGVLLLVSLIAVFRNQPVTLEQAKEDVNSKYSGSYQYEMSISKDKYNVLVGYLNRNGDGNLSESRCGGYVFSDSDSYLLYSVEENTIINTGDFGDSNEVNKIIDGLIISAQ